ncbi:MAG: chemotaxis protein CheB, partial [Limisphaerales bacterium]
MKKFSKDVNKGKARASPRMPLNKAFPIVGIGASAGGYEAFAEFLRELPKDTGMGFVLVQHLDPKHKSQLTQLLAHSAKIPVHEAAHNTKVLPDCLYVIPENSNLTLANGRLRLHPRQEH